LALRSWPKFLCSLSPLAGRDVVLVPDKVA
jgi:hypothetical protein